MRRALLAALIGGLVACFAVSAAQHALVVPLILKAEAYEDAAHKAAAPQQAASAQPGHVHEDEGWKPEDGLERVFYTVLANLGLGVGFGLMLAAAFTLAGARVGAMRGLLWGLGGFLAFAAAPSLGLPPEPPGAVSAALFDRQLWWAGTAAATAMGLAAIVFGRAWWWKALGVALLTLPHLVGAPHPAGAEAAAVPAELAARFIVMSLFSTAVFWAVLGTVAGAVHRRLDDPAPA